MPLTNSQKPLVGSKKEKPVQPVIRQTRTSILRMRKHDIEYIQSTLQKSQIDVSQPTDAKNRSSVMIGPVSHQSRSVNTITKTNNTVVTKTKRNMHKMPRRSLEKIGNTKKQIKRNNKDQNIPLRRSLSAVHRKTVSVPNRNMLIQRSHSVELPGGRARRPIVTIQSPIQEESPGIFLTPVSTFKTSNVSGSTVSFYTPPTHNRSSVMSRNSSTPYINTPAPKDLHKRLNVWLKGKGKNMNEYHHLRCFGIHMEQEMRKVAEPETKTVVDFDEENKENIEQVDNNSYNDLKIDLEEKEPELAEAQPVQTQDLLAVRNGALHDLHNLISEGYPSKLCETWLLMLSSKFDNIEDLPEYWECRAAVEESYGNLAPAVECYHQAIVKGAAVERVDESLDNMLQKFKLLDLNCEQTKEDDRRNRRHEKNAIDAKYLMKSTIINFAVQERKNKKKAEAEAEAKKFIATPVRRSTRLSVSRTPGVVLCESLQDLEEDIRNNVMFHTNKALHRPL